MKDMTNRNSKGQLHGYQEWYTRGKLCFKAFFNNNKIVDYQEYGFISGKLINRIFYI